MAATLVAIVGGLLAYRNRSVDLLKDMPFPKVSKSELSGGSDGRFTVFTWVTIDKHREITLTKATLRSITLALPGGTISQKCADDLRSVTFDDPSPSGTLRSDLAFPISFPVTFPKSCPARGWEFAGIVRVVGKDEGGGLYDKEVSVPIRLAVE